MNTDEETSADWADRLQMLDSGANVSSLLGAQQEEAQGEDTSPSRWSLEPSENGLTARIRDRLRQEYGVERAEYLVRQVSPSLLAALHVDSEPPAAVLVAYFDACPYSRATEDALVSLAARMHRRNLAGGQSQLRSSTPYVIMMYDTKAKGNRSFAAERLQARPVPKLFTVVPQGRAIVPWNGEPMGEVRPSATREGEWTRTLPEQALMETLDLHCGK